MHRGSFFLRGGESQDVAGDSFLDVTADPQVIVALVDMMGLETIPPWVKT